MFTKAIVRKPCPEMIHGLSSTSLGVPDYQLALQQHSAYVEALGKCKLNVTVLESDSRFPDSCFVEDVTLCTSSFAVLCNPGVSEFQKQDGGLSCLSLRF